MTTTSDPVRTCVGCRAARPTVELVRLRLAVDGHAVDAIVTDPSAGGRGAWLCAAPEDLGGLVEPRCLADAASSRAFDRAFRRRIDPALVEDLMRRMSPPGDGGRLRNRR